MYLFKITKSNVDCHHHPRHLFSCTITGVGWGHIYRWATQYIIATLPSFLSMMTMWTWGGWAVGDI